MRFAPRGSNGSGRRESRPCCGGLWSAKLPFRVSRGRERGSVATEIEVDRLVIDLPEDADISDEELARQVAERLFQLAEEE